MPTTDDLAETIRDLWADEWPVDIAYLDWADRHAIAGRLLTILDTNQLTVAFEATPPATTAALHVLHDSIRDALLNPGAVTRDDQLEVTTEAVLNAVMASTAIGALRADLQAAEAVLHAIADEDYRGPEPAARARARAYLTANQPREAHRGQV